jgi:hypothetical protein
LIGPVGLLIQAGFLGGSNGQLGGPQCVLGSSLLGLAGFVGVGGLALTVFPSPVRINS